MTDSEYMRQYRKKHPEYVKKENTRRVENERMKRLKHFIDKQTTKTQEGISNG